MVDTTDPITQHFASQSQAFLTSRFVVFEMRDTKQKHLERSHRRVVITWTEAIGYMSRITLVLIHTVAVLQIACVHADAADFPKPVIRDIEGWTIEIDPQLLTKENREQGELALKALANHLQRIIWILPEDRVNELRNLPIRIDWNHELSNMQYHPSRGWLERNGHDPNLEKHVHIPRARQLLNPSQWAKHPYVVLHELAHAYHDQVLTFEEPEIISNYQNAKNTGIYENVTLYTGAKVKHYGLTNHKEYFAECSEAYLGVNDFFPFVRAELREHDPRMYTCMEKIWGKIR